MIHSSYICNLSYINEILRIFPVEKNLEKVEIEEIMNDDPEILNLKNNFVPLEDLFDSKDVARKQKMEPLRVDIEECNMGTEEKPKLIK